MALGASPSARDPLDDLAAPSCEVLAAAPGGAPPCSGDAPTAVGASPSSAGVPSEDSPPAAPCTATAPNYDPAVERRARALACCALVAACLLSAAVLFRPPLPMGGGAAWQTARPVLRMSGGGWSPSGNRSEAVGGSKRYKTLRAQEGRAGPSTVPVARSTGNGSEAVGMSKRYKSSRVQKGDPSEEAEGGESKTSTLTSRVQKKKKGGSGALARANAKEAALREARVFKSRPLVFVHVPKVAGSAISAATDDLDLPIPVRAACWRHTPPSQHIRGGFVVVRPVLERLISEFKWVRRRQMWYEVYQAENYWPDAADSPCNCRTFNQYLAAALNKLDTDPYYPDCHLVPQWCYASKVDYIVPYSDRLEESLRMLHPTLAEVSLEEVNSNTKDKHAEGPATTCRVTPSCVSGANLRLAKRHFREDFENLEPALRTALRAARSSGSAPRPFTPGLGFVLGPTVKKNRDCDVTESGTTKTLLSPSPCQPLERPPGVRKAVKSTCVPDMEECAQLAARHPDCSSTITYHGDREGPRGRYPGWCKCVLRGERCVELEQKNVTIASFAKPAALEARCTPPPVNYRPDLHLSKTARVNLHNGKLAVHRGNWGREYTLPLKTKKPKSSR